MTDVDLFALVVNGVVDTVVTRINNAVVEEWPRGGTGRIIRAAKMRHVLQLFDLLAITSWFSKRLAQKVENCLKNRKKSKLWKRDPQA